jgi:hypothetical protein
LYRETEEREQEGEIFMWREIKMYKERQALTHSPTHPRSHSPTQVLIGVESAFRDLIGDDRQEDVGPGSPATAPQLHPHPNRFEYGPRAVPDNAAVGFGPAWWERMKVRRLPPRRERGAGEERREGEERGEGENRREGEQRRGGKELRAGREGEEKRM